MSLVICSLTFEKQHFPTIQDAAKTAVEYGVDHATKIIEHPEAWRIEVKEPDDRHDLKNLNPDEGAIATVYREYEDGESDGEFIEGSDFRHPTDAELKKIQKFAPKDITYKKEELQVVEMIASDNLRMMSGEKWSLNCLDQMAKTYPGEQLIPDHNWYKSEGGMGLVFDAWIDSYGTYEEYLGIEDNKDVINNGGEKTVNRRIIKTEGFHQLKIKVFFEAGHDCLKEMKFRRLFDLSTGGIWKEMPDYLCPHCIDEQTGKNLSIFSEDCPHTAPYPVNVFFLGKDPSVKMADYVLVDGKIISKEISTVVAGDVPAAMIS